MSKDIETLKRVAERERSPMYNVGDVTNDHRFTFNSQKLLVLNQWIMLWKISLEVLQNNHDRKKVVTLMLIYHINC